MERKFEYEENFKIFDDFVFDDGYYHNCWWVKCLSVHLSL